MGRWDWFLNLVDPNLEKLSNSKIFKEMTWVCISYGMAGTGKYYDLWFMNFDFDWLVGFDFYWVDQDYLNFYILFSIFQIICKNSTLYTDMVLKKHTELELYSDEKGFVISEKVSSYYCCIPLW